MSFIVVIIVLALIFDYINGFHDAANSIATIVSTKVLTPFQAVIWAALFTVGNFLYGRLGYAVMLLVVSIISGSVLIGVIRRLWT